MKKKIGYLTNYWNIIVFTGIIMTKKLRKFNFISITWRPAAMASLDKSF